MHICGCVCVCVCELLAYVQNIFIVFEPFNPTDYLLSVKAFCYAAFSNKDGIHICIYCNNGITCVQVTV